MTKKSCRLQLNTVGTINLYSLLMNILYSLNSKAFKTTLLFFWQRPKFRPTPTFYEPMPPMPKFNEPKPAMSVASPCTVATHELTLSTQPSLSSRLLLSNINNSAHNVIIRGDFSAKHIDFDCSKQIIAVLHWRKLYILQIYWQLKTIYQHIGTGELIQVILMIM